MSYTGTGLSGEASQRVVMNDRDNLTHGNYSQREVRSGSSKIMGKSKRARTL